MVKKKIMDIGIARYERPPVPDNNPDGPSNLPDDRLEGAMYPAGKIAFADMVGKGESPNAPDVNTITANGVSRSRGQDKGRQYDWGNGTDGHWNENGDWEGANLTG